MPERILREHEARYRVGLGKTKFHEDVAPRLVRVQIGPRAVGYTESSVERLIQELIAESAALARYSPPPNRQPKPASKRTAPKPKLTSNKKLRRRTASVEAATA
jgi:predicted DNA-binding transcriptional regulator AlpA